MTLLARCFGLAAVCLATTLALAPVEAAERPIGGVVEVEPEAFGTPPKGKRNTLEESDPVIRDETVETSSSGYLHLRFVDRSNLWLDADSRLVLDELVYDRAENAGEYAVELGTGLFRIITGALPHKSYEFRTPTAVIGVRGTDFTVQVAKNGATKVSVYAGVVTVTPRIGGKAREIKPPETASIARSNGPVLVSRGSGRVAPPARSLVEWPLPEVDIVEVDDFGRNVGAGSGSSGNGSSAGGSTGGSSSGGSTGGSSSGGTGTGGNGPGAGSGSP